MGTLQEDIKAQSDWVVRAFSADNYMLDGTINSFIEIDRFFINNMGDGKPKKGGRLHGTGFGPILFSIGSYVGETIIKNVPGAEWVTDDNDPMGEVNVSMTLPNGTVLWPIQKAMKRFENGDEDSIYPYAYTLLKEYVTEEFNERFWSLRREDGNAGESVTKPWWKFW